MTRDRVTRLARLARAQRAVADLRASETARLHEAHGETAAAAGQIVDALNGDSPLHGLLVDVMANALMRNAIDTARLNSQRNAGPYGHSGMCATSSHVEKDIDVTMSSCFFLCTR